MKTQIDSYVEQHRQPRGVFPSLPGSGPCGTFIFEVLHVRLLVLCTVRAGWEHVLVKPADLQRCASWEEMKIVRYLFFEPAEAVMQLFPPDAQYINNDPYMLHLWRPQQQAIPLPPPEIV